MSYDVKCYALAEAFLDEAGYNNTVDKNKLAQAIQDTIEDYIVDLDNQEDL